MKNLAAVVTVLLVSVAIACGTDNSSTPSPTATTLSSEEIRRMVQVALDKQENPATPLPRDQVAKAPTPDPAGTASHSPDPGYLAEARTRCLHWAADNLNPTQYQNLKDADPQNLTDLERALWRQPLRGGPWRYYPNEPEVARLERDGNIHCRIYWGEPVSQHNATKRNKGFRYQCEQWIEKSVREDYNSITQQMNQRIRNSKETIQIPNQFARLRQWLAMGSAQLLNTTEPPYAALRAVSRHEYAHDDSTSEITPEADREWRQLYQGEYRPEFARALRLFGMSTGGNSESISCRLYYPQLFYGYWIPIDDTDPDYQRLMVPADLRTSLPTPGEHGTLHVGKINETPVYLPDAVTHDRILPGYPIGKGSDDGQYHTCGEGSNTKSAGYQYVPHPGGHYCEPISQPTGAAQ